MFDGAANSIPQCQRRHLFGQSKKVYQANGCSEHGMIVNELLHDANHAYELGFSRQSISRMRFGSIPSEMIMSVMKHETAEFAKLNAAYCRRYVSKSDINH
jgi:hypothetical protein